MNNNRDYSYSNNSITHRPEYSVIEQLINKNVSVIDLGCGDGSLLLQLKKKKGITKSVGLEISETGVMICAKKRIKAIKMRIDEKLPFGNKEFNYAICNMTLQMVMYPEILLREMVRISNKQIITFPNFAYILNRFELLIKGIMPKSMIPGYNWYSTGHIHQLSIKDFKDYCFKNNLYILKVDHIYPNRFFIIPKLFLKILPNLFANTGIFLTSSLKND